VDATPDGLGSLMYLHRVLPDRFFATLLNLV
jgi:hypothetical protein